MAERALRAAALTALPLLAAGCSHDITRLDRNCDEGWCPEARQVARGTWQYAQLSQNAYWQEAEESDDYRYLPYVLAPELKERFASVDDRYGYAYSLFDRFDEAGNLREVVLVYRGTEGPKDWWHGTLLGRQGPRGLATYRQVRAGLDDAGYRGVPVALAGHSLGGRIADHVLKKLAREDGALPATLSSYMFNPNAGGAFLSPPTDWQVDRAAPVHVSVAEAGEIAGWVRVLADDRQWDGYVVDCQTTFSPIAKHYMRRLADCLTWIAALDDAEARTSVERNEIAPPPIEARLKPGANQPVVE